ncbi:3-oxoacyl-[acyl-carrier-protein] synthase II [Amycolatopsis xylanica]|uniref:3-oxoacyl-[acyl-carrier-protein] synthase II n=1 Tax=Amycolatopsis xylanica TaxID=589385 RepID=A0A1H3PF69_9PSEU|nr:beta-ketoacyl-[acyl-carrier-protein] synthase family protein [Amycolatopsis xylanica]SDY99812.1 3-oxoacyl-[acyl-carrier-protein] synthase II [Amycolatopsis xylanica]
MGEAVWVTGLGAVTPAGWTAAESWATVAAGKSCVREVKRFTTFESSSRIAGMVPGSEATLPEHSLSLEYGLNAAKQAIADSGLESRVDTVIVANHGERRLPSEAGSGRVIGVRDIAAGIAEAARTNDYSSPYGACAGSAQAIGSAAKLIRAGRARTVLAGGCDALVTPFDFFSFSSLYVMSSRDCPPEEASCPFDIRRDGFVLAEGAGFLMLEAESHARARGAEPIAVLEGFGLRQNAYHMFAPPPDGLGPEQAMREALRDAKLNAEDISYLNAHGTSTKDNDSSESMAIRAVFGPHADRLPVSSNKSQIGHTMGACGAIEAVLSIESLRAGVIPPTSNLREPDPACDLDYVPLTARERKLDHVLSNSFGFGGHSASLIFGRAA